MRENSRFPVTYWLLVNRLKLLINNWLIAEKGTKITSTEQGGGGG
jgi:hypothetical protein